jgi:general secretion pathway protein D
MKFNKLVLGVILLFSIEVAQAEKIKVNFNNLKISDFIIMLSKITGKNILIDGDVKGKINFVTKHTIEKSELIPLATAILETKKMTLLDRGSYYQVVKSTTAPGEGIPVTNSSQIANNHSGTMKTVIFQLSNVNSAVIRTKIKPLLHKSAKVISFKKNNLLAITAYPRTLKSIKQLIDKIEQKQSKKSKIIHLQNARVKDIFANVQSMSKALFPQDIVSEKVAVMQDISGNAIILVGKQSNLQRLENYIAQLDREGQGDTQKMHVIPLSNSNVEDMEKILSKIVPQMTGAANNGGARAGAPIGKGGKPVPKAVIASDAERNALIVLASEDQYQNILDTVKQLDVEKSQVYIQAKIVEVNTNLAENIGLKYGFNGGSITSNGLFSISANAGAAPLALSSSLLGFLNNTTTQFDNNGNAYTSNERAFEFDSGITKVFSLGAQLDLLKQNGAAQILSKPSVLSTNNKESSIYVGRTQSILTQAQQSTQGSSSVINNYSREDIGITLKVKPRLSSNNKVSLEIETTIEDILPGSGTSADRPTTTKRSVKTNAIVNHAETIILGGLIKSADGKSVTKIPILGDIPIIGRLFTSKGNSGSKVNVVIYITPYIIKKSSDLSSLRQHLSELEAVQQQYNKIVFEELESKMKNSSKKGHVTFSSKSTTLNNLNSDEFSDDENDNTGSVFDLTSQTETEEVDVAPIAQQQVVTPSSAPVVYQRVQRITPTTTHYSNDTYSEEDEYVQSSSIMESLQENQSVDVQSLNTGIEYNEGTTFTNTTQNSNY